MSEYPKCTATNPCVCHHTLINAIARVRAAEAERDELKTEVEKLTKTNADNYLGFESDFKKQESIIGELKAANDNLRGIIRRMDDERGISDLNAKIDDYIDRICALTAERDELKRQLTLLRCHGGAGGYR